MLNGGINKDDMRRSHVWVGGMMYVDAEDVEELAHLRPVECEGCGDGYPSIRLCPVGPEANGAL